MDNLILYALLKQYAGGGGGGDGDTPDLSKYVTKEDLKKALNDLDIPNGVYLFATSSISSTFAGPAGILNAENLVNPELGEKIKINDLAIFPDDKSNVIYIGIITEIEDYPYLTVSNITYLKDNWIFTGDWHQGMISSYPEVYRFEGGLWLCLGSSITNPPHEESEQEVKEWKLLADSGNDEIRPTYYKLAGDAMTDMGDPDASYTLAKANLTPLDPEPQIGDVVIFNTDSAVYVGLITTVQSSAVVAQAKLQLGGGTITTGVTKITVGNGLKASSNMGSVTLGLNLTAGQNISINEGDDGAVVISATVSGGGTGVIPEDIEIEDKNIKNVNVNKLIQTPDENLILDGGNV